MDESALTSDLCDHYLMVQGRRCHNYWREEFDLPTRVEVGGNVMFGSYRAGVWRFCRTHARIFRRDIETEGILDG